MPKSNNNIFVKLKEDKGARAIAITVLVMLLVLTAIIVTTVIANRAPTEDPLPPEDSSQVGIEDPDDGNENETPDDQKPGDNEDDKPTNALPTEFRLPVSGVLRSVHDSDLQVFSPTMGDYRVHLGIDIGTVEGAHVSAMADGTVSQI